MSHYETLGITSAATSAQIKSAYRGLVKIYHPDLNPSAEAHGRMQAINEAYEVLSDFYSRQMYDMMLAGHVFNLEPPQETEAQRFRREYKQRKVREERIQMENLIKLKVRFYRGLRTASYVFFALGVLFTLDYYFHPFQKAYSIRSMESSYYQTEVTTTGGIKWLADWELLAEYNQRAGDQVQVHFSLVFRIPARIQLVDGTNEYRVSRTLHSFRNIITLIIISFSAVVMRNREFTDFRLTCALVPILLLIFQLLMAFSPAGH